jgi:ribosomal protein L37E
MSHDDLEFDEDWYDEDDADDDEEAGRCPECGAPIYSVADRCPACGYWLSESDRRSLWTSDRPIWLKVTAVILLLAFVALVACGLF